MEAGNWTPLVASKAPWEHRQPPTQAGPDGVEPGSAAAAQQQRAEELEEQRRTQLAVQIFQDTRHDLDLDKEATVYEFPVGLLGLPCDMPKPGGVLEPLADIGGNLRRELTQQNGKRCKPMLVRVQGKESLGVCLVQPNSYDQKYRSAAAIPMANPNQAPVRAKIEELRAVCCADQSVQGLAEEHGKAHCAF